MVGFWFVFILIFSDLKSFFLLKLRFSGSFLGNVYFSVTYGSFYSPSILNGMG